MTAEPLGGCLCGPEHDDALPAVSVILITRDRHEQALAAVASVLACTYPPSKREIVVVEETDTPQPIGDPAVRYVSIPRKNLGFALARSIGVSNASHEWYAFLDDDCIADRQWLRALVSAIIDHPHAAAAGGAVLVPACGRVGQCENILGFPGGGVRYVHEAKGRIVPRPTFSTCNCIVSAAALREANGFDTRCALGGEDEVLSRAISNRSLVLYTPYAIVYHAPRDDLRKVFCWFIRRGKGKAAMLSMAAMPARERWAFCRNSLLLRSGGALLLLLLLRVPLLPAAAIFAAAYYCAMLWRFRWSWRFFPSCRTLALVPVVKMVMDVGYDLGIISAWIRRRATDFR